MTSPEIKGQIRDSMDKMGISPDANARAIVIIASDRAGQPWTRAEVRTAQSYSRRSNPWNAPYSKFNRREERCEDRLAYFLRRLSLDLVGIARATKGEGTLAGEKFCENLAAIDRHLFPHHQCQK